MDRSMYNIIYIIIMAISVADAFITATHGKILLTIISGLIVLICYLNIKEK